jgi:alpha-tubulin suppressor-like RCC1 family protein
MVVTGSEESFTITAFDAEGDSIRFSVYMIGREREPGFVSVEKTSPTTALVTLDPLYRHEGVYYMGVQATDDSNNFFNTDFERFTLTIRASVDQVRSFYRLPIPVRETPTAAAMGLGASHSCMIGSLTDGDSIAEALCWGSNEGGQLGFQPEAAGCGPDETACSGTPGRVDIPLSLVSVDGSSQHSCGLTDTGEAWCWGLGYGGTVPMPIQTELRFAELKVAPADSTSCGRTEEGRLYCWTPDTAPNPVAEGFSFVTFDLGGDFACGRDEDLRTFCWGNNWYGQLGIGNVGQEDGPVSSDDPVEVVGGHRFRDLALGLVHACGLAPLGEAYCWGYLASRTGRESVSGVPEFVTSDDTQGGNRGFRQIASGDLFACGIYRGLDAPTACWGDIAVGRILSDAEATFPRESILLDPQISPDAIAAGGGHACGIADEEVFCWGDNDKGQLGRIPAGAR